MKKTFLFCLLLCFPAAVLCQRAEVKPFIEFLEKQQTSPVDYLMGLFEKYDIVVLGERLHPEMTQYELIEQIIADQRFISNVGNIFTEVGITNKTEELNMLLRRRFRSEEKFRKELRKLYRDLDFNDIWNYTNYWNLLNFIHNLNMSLPDSSTIYHGLTDMAFDWNKYTTQQQYEIWNRMVSRGDFREVQMAYNFISLFNTLPPRRDGKPKKALVIMNSPHCYQKYTRLYGDLVTFFPSLVAEVYPGRIANVLINTDNFRHKELNYLVAGGIWDAAFRYHGNPNVGFDFNGSPFGDTPFDNYDKPKEGTTYKNIFTGFVFYKPIEQWISGYGIPDVFDKKSIPELARRYYIQEGEMPNDKTLKEIIDDYNTVKYYDYFTDRYAGEKTKEKMDAAIGSWLK